jgi:hypothetical protein
MEKNAIYRLQVAYTCLQGSGIGRCALWCIVHQDDYDNELNLWAKESTTLPKLLMCLAYPTFGMGMAALHDVGGIRH